MSSREEKLRYLNHHWSYELLMLRYTYARLHDTKQANVERIFGSLRCPCP